MPITFGFYNSVGGDRRYNADQMSAIFDGIINDGIFASIGDAFVVSAVAGMNISVGSGRAWFNHTWTNNDVTLPLILDPAGVGLSRIDAVVLEVNSDVDVRANSIKIIKGTPSGSPVAPVMVSTDLIHQYPLCYIDVEAGVTEIMQVNITNKIGTSDCPFITGILETINIDTLLGQWEDEFNNWFTTLESILDSDTAGNLLNLINTNITNIEAINAAIVTVATANKILKLNGAGKLPADITGEAGKINGVYFRNNAGTLEWSTDNATWNSVGGTGIGSFEFGLPII